LDDECEWRLLLAMLTLSMLMLRAELATDEE